MGFLKARENAGLTQKEVAEMVGVDQSSVSLWENGKNKPRVSVLVKLAGIYCCTLEEILREDDE